MARQIGDIILVGTIDDITFYEMEGKGYARSKSSLTGQRVKRDPRFQRTMQSAHRLGRGSQLASKVYRSLPREEQVYALFKELRRIAVLALKEGKGEKGIMMLLQQHLVKHETRETGPLRDQPFASVPAKELNQSPSLFQVNRNRKIKTVMYIRRKEAGRKNARWLARCRQRRMPEAEAGHSPRKSMLQVRNIPFL